MNVILKINMKLTSPTKNRKTDKIKIFSKKKNVEDIDKIIKKLENTQVDISKVESFRDFPLSPPTLKGLKESGYESPTEIQKESLVHSLQGLDILGAAKTGSGKTLAFLIPVLETLYKNKWTRFDGVGALIITPTRELAYQIFETLRKVGFYHDISAGLIIGGKDLHFEKHRMDKVNIVICTPGRLLQHMDENPLFDCVNMKVLVLDEADRCLDLGFEKTMNSIIENLPSQRQTLLFSATQTKSVRDLARLSLKDPKYISVHEHSEHSTPTGLIQNFVVCQLHEKMSMLWSFIKNHPKHKILVFLSSCKQVKFMYEIMLKLRPSNTLLALYGTLHQERRMKVYNMFADKQHAVLLATDIAARGLDFPEVNWVVQLDCPEDANTYIHRAGRTARYHKGGESLLVLLPSEKQAMLRHLEEKRIPINEIKINPVKLINPQVKMKAFLTRSTSLKESAQRAFVAYFKSVFLMKDKKVFNVSTLDPEAYARSLGLAVPPRIRFLQKYNKSQLQKTAQTESELPAAEIKDLKGMKHKSLSNDLIKPSLVMQNEAIDSSCDKGDSDNEEDCLTVKSLNHQSGDICKEYGNKLLLKHVIEKSTNRPLTKAAVIKKMLKNDIILNTKVLFSDTEEIFGDEAKVKTEGNEESKSIIFGNFDIREVTNIMKDEDKTDIKYFREKVQVKHKERKRKEKKLKQNQESDGDEVDAYSRSETDESEPDLSWLPDPDEVFNKNSNDLNSEEDSQSDENSTQRHSKFYGKRKRKKEGKKYLKKCKVSPSIFYDEPTYTSSSLKEDEKLVLQCLSSK